MAYSLLQQYDSEVYQALVGEDKRQENNLELIASENFVSQEVLQAYTSTLTNKYAEGYPAKRYYGGCTHADQIETLAIERLKKIFKAPYANVQPHSGAQANMAATFSVLQPGDTFMGMDLAHGGHLTHGSKVNYSGLYYHVVAYGVDKKNHLIDFNQVERLAKEHKPKLIIVGASAYPRIIDFSRFAEIAKSINAKLMVDMAHIAGLVAADLHPTPIPYADLITSTTHKTLRGPRGGIVLTNQEADFKKINSRVFPGVQGGPLMHIIAAKAVAFGEALRPEFKEYQQQVVHNAKVLAETLLSRGFQLVSGGTENHLLVVNTFATKGVTGKDAQELLEEVGITANKNTLPFDENKPAIASGVRLGSPALTTRGFGRDEFIKVANLIADVLENPQEQKVKESVKTQVAELCKAYPMEAFRFES